MSRALTVRVRRATAPTVWVDVMVMRSGGRAEQLERDVVGVPEGQARSVVGVDDAAVGDAQLVEARLPLLELLTVLAAEGHVVEPGPVLLELLGGLELREAVHSEQRVAEQVDGVMEGAGGLVENRLDAEQARVPRHADGKVVHRDGDVGDGGKRGHWHSLRELDVSRR